MDDDDGEQRVVRWRAQEDEMPWFDPAISSSRRSSCVEPYVSLAKTQPGLRPSYESQTTFRKGSPPPSGTGCSVENLSTSTRSSHQCTLSSLMRKERDTWDQLKLFLPSQRPSGRSKPDQSGLQPSGERLRQPHSFSPIEGRNCLNMRNISRASLLPSMSEPT